MKTVSCGLISGAACLTGGLLQCLAGDVQVSTAGFLQVTNDTVSVSSVPVSDGCPLDPSEYPVFWLDCTQTNGWEFTGDGSVTKIPSLSGSRYLTTTEFTSWTGWGNGTYPPLPPAFLPSDETLGGRPSLDFGELGSMRAMLFDPYEYPSGARTNILHGIGSIVAVWGSQNGGGWVMGGGPNTWNGNDGASYAWHRGYSAVEGSNQFSYDSPLFISHGYANPFNRGVRHDGMMTSGYSVGFNRAWEVISLPSQDATASASGFGLGDTRTSKRWYSGGMKVAELMIFDRVLTAGEIIELEVWLQKKWFDRTAEGRGGNNRISRFLSRSSSTTGAKPVLDVPEGETLTVGRLEGSRGIGAAVEKRGAGTLSVKDASGYAGDLRLAEGRLAFSKRPVPSLSELPERYLHFDAADESAFETETRDGIEYLVRWKDLAGGKVTRKNVFLAQDTESLQPQIERNALGEGLHMADFRSISDGACMRFRKGTESDAADATLGSICTVIAVIGAQRGGGRVAMLGHDAFRRVANDTDLAAYGPQLPILNPNTINSSQGIYPTNGVAWVDGLKKGPLEGFDTPGYQVLAMQVPGGEVKWFGADGTGGAAGGFRVGEVFIYNRLLSDREIEDVQAYLMNRWFAREAPGYEKTAARAAVPDVQRLVVSGSASLEVAEGSQVRVGSLSTSGSLSVAGEGVLLAESVAATGSVRLAGSTLKLTSTPETGVSDLAVGAVLHFDASDAASMETVSLNGTNFVSRWRSKDFRNAAYLPDSKAAYRPWLNSDRAVNGTASVDFGSYRNGGAFLALEHTVDSMRDVFAVLDGEKGGGFLFGARGGLKNASGDEAPNWSLKPVPEITGGDFHPDLWRNPYCLLTESYSPMFMKGGCVLTNGVTVVPSSTPFPTVASLVEYHGRGAVSGAWIGGDKPAQYAGGFRLVELVAYDRTLSLRERVATRNHLMSKWFGADPEPLPEDAASSVIGAVSGEGSLVKEDDGELSAGDFGSFTGTVSVAAGTLKLAMPQTEALPRLAEEGRIAHFDASVPSTVTTVEMDGYTGFSEWRSKVGGWKAVPIAKYFPEFTSGSARLMKKSQNGLDTFFLKGAESPMLFEDSTGVTNDISGIRSVFWVIGTVNDVPGGFILGGGFPKKGTLDPWMGPDGRKADPSTPLLSDSYASGYACYENFCAWYMNGESFRSNQQGFDENAWHVLDMSFKPTVPTTPTAGGFAFDSRIITQENGWSDFRKYSGNQNLAEVIFYDRVLSEQERKETEAYLLLKWGLRSMKPENAVFDIAEGATLDLGGATHELPSLVGAGSVVNGSLAFTKLIADAAAGSVPSLAGEAVLKSGAAVELRNVRPETSVIPVVYATSVSGDLRDVVFVGDAVPQDRRVRLRFADGTLSVKILDPGFSVILR